jgi:hypothetical protein
MDNDCVMVACVVFVFLVLLVPMWLPKGERNDENADI